MAFFGTPQIALPVLEALERSVHEVVAVVTGPDRPAGRGMQVGPTPVKARAEAAGLPVLQPPNLRSEQAQSALSALDADVFVVVAYGLILPPAVLEIPPMGCINVHFSLLPRWRGAAPVQWAIMQGDDTSGVSIMQMDAGLDTGPVLRTKPEPVRPEDTAGTLTARLSRLGADLLIEVLAGLESIQPRRQPEAGATYAAKLTSQDAHIAWTMPAGDINNRIRAFNPRPGAWGLLAGGRLKLLKAQVTERPSGAGPGVVEAGDGSVMVNTGTTMLELLQVQPEGRLPMPVSEFLRGRRLTSGERIT